MNKNVKFVNKSLSAKFVVIGFVLLSNLFDVSGQSKKFETRCGWLANPTPANYWFYDKDGEWTIGEQGGYGFFKLEVACKRFRPTSIQSLDAS